MYSAYQHYRMPEYQHYGPLARYVKLRVRMRRECRERFPRHRRWAIPTCITARASRTCRDACRDRQLSVSFEIGGGGKRSRHSRRMHNLQFYVSGKRPMVCLPPITNSVAWRRCKHFLWILRFHSTMLAAAGGAGVIELLSRASVGSHLLMKKKMQISSAIGWPFVWTSGGLRRINLLWPGGFICNTDLGNINLGNGLYLIASIHYLKQRWLFIKRVLWHPPVIDFAR